MKVERLMAVLRCGNEIVGYARIDKVLGMITCRIDGVLDTNIDTIIRLNDESVEVFELDSSLKYDLNIRCDNIGHFECVLVDRTTRNVVASGANDLIINESDIAKCYDDYIKANSKNSDTYNRVMLDSNALNNDLNEIDLKTESMDNILDNVDGIQEDTTHDKQDDNKTKEEILDDKKDAKGDDITLKAVKDSESEPIYSEKHPFYKEIDGQLDDLFSRYEHEIELEGLILNSTFAKIYYDDNNYYVVGKICDDKGVISLVAYGYPTSSKKAQPKEINNDYIWLPLDREKQDEKGYYLMYQNGVNGEVLHN